MTKVFTQPVTVQSGAFLLNTKRCFVGRDIIHFSVRQVSDIPPRSLGFSLGILPWGGNDSGVSLLRLLSGFPAVHHFIIAAWSPVTLR